MAQREPIEVTNLDRYGSPALLWSRARDVLANPSRTDRFFLGTVRPDGRPHAAGVGALWFDGDLYIVSGPGTRKSRNLAANPACTLSAPLRGIDLVLEGEAARVTDAQQLDRLAAAWAQKWDGRWAYEVSQDGFRHDVGTALVFAVRPAKVLAFAKGGFSHTRHRF